MITGRDQCNDTLALQSSYGWYFWEFSLPISDPESPCAAKIPEFKKEDNRELIWASPFLSAPSSSVDSVGLDTDYPPSPHLGRNWIFADGPVFHRDEQEQTNDQWSGEWQDLARAPHIVHVVSLEDLLGPILSWEDQDDARDLDNDDRLHWLKYARHGDLGKW